MKKLHFSNTECFIHTDKEIFECDFSQHSPKLRYGEGDNVVKNIESIEQLRKYIKIYSYGFFKPIITFCVKTDTAFLDSYGVIYKSSFRQATIVRTFKEVNPDEFTIKELSNKLPASEFLDFMKDNGMNTIFI